MTGARRRWALVVVCTTSLMMSIDTLVLNVALPTLARELGASPSQLQWIVDTYILVFAGMLLVAGSLGDRYGRARVLRIGLLVFAASSAAAAWSTDPTTLIVCRGVMGIGSAFCLPNSVAIITNMFLDARERGRALGVWAAIGGLGLALGPVVGGFLLSEFWWGSVFLVNVPIVLAAYVVGLWALPESRHPSSSRFDVVGVALSIVSVAVLVYAMIEAPTHGWASTSTLGLLAASSRATARPVHRPAQDSLLLNGRYPTSQRQ